MLQNSKSVHHLHHTEEEEMSKLYLKNCRGCFKEFESASKNKLLCSPCVARHILNSHRLHRAKVKNRPTYKKANRERVKQYRLSKRNRLKEFARNTINNLIQAGKLKRPLICSACRSSEFRIQAHHDDYSKPFIIRWLCTSCHSKLHAKERVNVS